MACPDQRPAVDICFHGQAGYHAGLEKANSTNRLIII